MTGDVSEGAYLLVYAMHEAATTGAATEVLKSALLEAVKEDDDVANAVGATIERLSDDSVLERLADIVFSTDKATVEAYLTQGPSSREVFGGETSTPEGVAKLALAILNVKDGDRVIDYGSGRGNFLEQAAAQCPSAVYFGVDDNSGALAIAKARSKMSGSKIQYTREDIFRYFDGSVTGNPVQKAFSNYPWGIRTKNLKRSSRYVDKVLKGQERYGRPTSADWVFNRVLVDSLNRDGIAVGIMSNGACFNGVDRPVREYFVDNGLVKAVVALPKGVFAPYTMIATSLVVLCSGGSQKVRFVDATDLGTDNRRGSSLDDGAVEAIVERLSQDSDKSATKTLTEIEARNYDLSARRYLEKEIEVPDGVPLGSVSTIIRGASVRAAELDALVCQEDTGISYLNLGDISDGTISQDLPNLSSLDKKLEKYCIHDGDVLISKNGAPFKVAVAEIPSGRKVLANGNLYIVRVDRERIDPNYLAAFLSSPSGRELLAREAVGTVIPNVPIKALSGLTVPLEGKERQKAVADAYLAKTDEIKILRLRLERARQEIADLFDEEA
jgi:type I restriction enzyme M protein